MARKRARARAEAVAARKRSREARPGLAVKVNPFEIRFNKRKQQVLGQKGARGERGMPGVSRARALEKVRRMMELELLVTRFIFPA